MSATIHEIKPRDYRDVATALRNLAGEIEGGEYGDVTSCAVVVFGDTLEIFGSGADSSGPTVHMLFHAGMQRIANEIEGFGR